MERILGIDYGKSRIGVAMSDPMGWTASGLETVKSKNAFKKAVSRIAEIIMKNEIRRVVVGWPLNMNGTSGESAEKVAGFIEALTDATSDHALEIIKWDERLSTVSAQKNMIELGISSRKKNTTVDKMAAQYILQNYLDRLRIAGGGPVSK
jgi:putative Holliday junction resolvase